MIYIIPNTRKDAFLHVIVARISLQATIPFSQILSSQGPAIYLYLDKASHSRKKLQKHGLVVIIACLIGSLQEMKFCFITEDL